MGILKKRCDFKLKANDPRAELILAYHDHRWGKAEHRDQELFAMLVLEGMQAGVSWAIILAKEANFRQAFSGFDPAVVATFDEAKVAELMHNPGIIRNQLKIRAAITNAQAFLKVQQEFGSFDAYIWNFTHYQVIDHHLPSIAAMPAKNALSEEVSHDLKRRGFQFVGPVIVYSYLQGIGVINDHCAWCEYR